MLHSDRDLLRCIQEYRDYHEIQYMQFKKTPKQYIAICYKYVVEQEFPGLHFYFLALIF